MLQFSVARSLRPSHGERRLLLWDVALSDPLFATLTLISALGTGLIAGVFFAFSSFVMKALGRLPAAQGIAAMQSINVVVINPAFLGTFFGTGLLCLILAALVVARWGAPEVVYTLAGSVIYIAGSILVTVFGNVPLNNALARVAPTSDEGAKLWARYLKTWTMWNSVRTAASLAACASFIMALARAG